MARAPHTASVPPRRLVPLIAVAASFAALAGCGGVKIKPTATLPKPIVEAMPTRVGLVIPGDMREFSHNETRWGVEWTVALGEGHHKLMNEVFHGTFEQVQEFRDIDEAAAAPDLKAIFEPRIEQYSFVTARETGGRYYAVTIRYRINLYTAQGDKVDSLTLTGYGNALAKGMSSGKPLAQASLAAMRDAAAKFLVQFPQQSVGERLARNEALVVEHASSADAGGIETVPIEESEPEKTVEASPKAPAPAAPETPSSVPAAPAAPKA